MGPASELAGTLIVQEEQESRNLLARLTELLTVLIAQFHELPVCVLVVTAF